MKKLKKFKKKLYQIKCILLSLLAICLSVFIKRDKKRVAFGAWLGELYIDNSKYLAEYAVNAYPNKKFYWVGMKEVKTSINPKLKFVKKDSFFSMWILLRCKYFFFSQSHEADICGFNVYRKATLCFLDHGNTVKKCGADDPQYLGDLDFNKFPWFRRLCCNIMGRSRKYEYICVSSPENTETYVTGYRFRVDERTKFISSGLPRNEIFYQNINITKTKEKYANLIGFDIEKKVILYLPTFRRKSEKVYSFTELNKEAASKLIEILNRHNAVLLEKNHYVANQYNCNRTLSAEEGVIKVTVPVDLQELLLISDVQISDYSGCFLDYLILDKPIIHFLYDYEEYKNYDSGLYYEAAEFAAGKVAETVDQVLQDLDEILDGNDNYKERRKLVKKRFLAYEHGNASEIILEEVFSR